MIKVKKAEAAMLLSAIENLQSEFESDWRNIQDYPLFRLRDVQSKIRAFLQVEDDRGPQICFHCNKPEDPDTYHMPKRECDIIRRKQP